MWVSTPCGIVKMKCAEDEGNMFIRKSRIYLPASRYEIATQKMNIDKI